MKLFYFAGRGRGEQVRLLLADLKQPYEDVRLDGAALGALKSAGKSDFGSVPVLEDGALTLAQGPVIMGYLARKYKLVDPTNLAHTAKLDSICLAAEDLRLAWFKLPTQGTDAEKAAARQEFVEKTIVGRWWPNLEKLLQGGHFFAGSPHPTHADYAIFDVLSALSIPGKLPEAIEHLSKFPALNAFYNSFNARPEIAAWIAKRPASPF